MWSMLVRVVAVVIRTYRVVRSMHWGTGGSGAKAVGITAIRNGVVEVVVEILVYADGGCGRWWWRWSL